MDATFQFGPNRAPQPTTRLRHEPCDICRGEQFEWVSGRDRNGRPLDSVICVGCGLVSHAAIPDDAALVEYYEHHYRREYQGEFTPSPFRVVREWRRGRLLVEMLQPLLSPRSRVFEVGCGIGCNVKQMELAGFDASGIEPGAGFSQFAAQHLGARVAREWLQNLPAIPQFDLVLLVHVLEHLRSPCQALRHIRELLNPNGRVYVEVPNLAAPHAAPGKLFHFAHLYNFTPCSLQTAGEASGFRLERTLRPSGSRSLGMLFQRNEDAIPITPRDGYRQAMEAIGRYNWLTYHARASYLLDRVRTAVHHGSNRWRARQRLAAIIQTSQQSLPPPDSGSASSHLGGGASATASQEGFRGISSVTADGPAAGPRRCPILRRWILASSLEKTSSFTIFKRFRAS